MEEHVRTHTLSLHRLSLLVGLEWQDGLERGAPIWEQRGETFRTLLIGTVMTCFTVFKSALTKVNIEQV